MSTELDTRRSEETDVAMVGASAIDPEMQESLKHLHEIQVGMEKENIEDKVAPSKMNAATVAEINAVEQEIEKLNEDIDDVVKSKHRYMVLSGIFLFLCVLCLVARVIAW